MRAILDNLSDLLQNEEPHSPIFTWECDLCGREMPLEPGPVRVIDEESHDTMLACITCGLNELERQGTILEAAV